MKLTQSISVSALCLWMCIAELVASRPVSAGDENTAQAILDAMLQAGKKVKNVNCRSEHVCWRSHALQERGYQDARNRGVAPKEAATNLREFTLDRYQFLFDDQGRFRVQQLQGKCDPNGKLLSTDFVTTHAWDGAVSTELFETDIKQGNIGAQSPLRETLDNSEPGAKFGKSFLLALQGALVRKEQVRVQTDEGKYRVEIVRPDESTVVGVVDPLHGYTVPHYELSVANGHRLITWDAKFREVSPGIWYPVEGVRSSGTPDNPASRESVKVTSVVVNDPKFDPAIFRIDFPKSTQVTDMRTGESRVAGENP